MRRTFASWALGLIFLVGCGEGELKPLNLREGCQPLLGGADCFLPYPSDFFLVPDSTTRTGRRIDTVKSAKLRTDEGTSADVSDWRAMDGFSKIPLITASFLEPTSGKGLISPLDDPALSLSLTDSKTLLIDTVTKQAVPHFADLDPLAEDPARQALILHPIVGLEAQRRYVVAIRGLEDPDGTPLDAPEGFRRLRDGSGASDASLQALGERYEEDVFGVLTEIGVDRSALQLAWDFTTGSDEEVSEDMFRVRELTLEWLRKNEPTFEITSVVEPGNEDPSIWRTVTGVVSGPMVLEKDTVEAALARDATGQVVVTGTVAMRFIAQIPAAIRDEPGRGAILGYGHGFFGSRKDVFFSDVKTNANRLRAVMISTDWRGMAEADRGRVVVDLVRTPNLIFSFTDQVHQAMANWLTMSYAIQNLLFSDPAFQRPGGAEPVYDPDDFAFVGLSMGGILVVPFAALSPDITRYILNVGGAGFTHIMFRSTAFAPFHTLMQAAISDPLEIQKYTASLQRHFDRIDSGFYAKYVFDEPLEGSPENRRLLLQIARADSRVPTFTGALLGRQLKLGVTKPTPISFFGIDEIESAPSGMTVFDFGEDEQFVRDARPPVIENGVHCDLFDLPAASAEMKAFLAPGGQVTSPCEGVCDPE